MDKKKRFVLTGLGILAPNGKGKEEYWQAIKEGRVGYKPVTLFETDKFKVNIAGEVSDFDPTVYMGTKGLRTLDRATKLLVSASKLAVADTGFEITDENTDDVGVSVGTTFGSLKSISDFDTVTIKEGPRAANPAHFPNTVINSPASQVSIWNNIQGFNTTIATGFTSSIDAMSYAYDFLRLDRVKIVFTGSVEEMCFQTFYGFHLLKFLSGSREGEPFLNCPFDKRRNGITFSEGAVLMAMEELEHAQKRGANIMAEVRSFGYYFDPYRINKYNPSGIGIKMAMLHALQNGGLKPEDIDCIFANANSTGIADRSETKAIKEAFGAYAYKIPVTAVKSMVGESYSAGGAMAVSAALGAIQGGFIPPTVNYQEKDPDCDLDYVPNKARKAELNHVLINSIDPNGSNSCVILERYKS
ncbi:MAG TPA: beta-ketoacyl-[acyl-carrier-protein] synthase family protein [Candidatus Omnitrophota bacterium]|nr:beta-ketoacyl-[acyl-carrier-protein] synthase family protein [Candidatus Omnitrophota bacterium]